MGENAAKLRQRVYGDPSAPAVLVQLVGREDLEGMEKEIALIRELSGEKPFCLISLETDDWDHELSPWEAPPVHGKEGFGDGAQDTLDRVLEMLGRNPGNIPGGESGTQQAAAPKEGSRRYYIGGYSLAGLFALWAVCRTDFFAGAAAASPSAWFPGFLPFLKEQGARTGRVYLSLGDKEAKTRNPVMSTVDTAIHEIYDELQAQGIPCTFEWNPGNHFRDPELRMAKGFAWLLREEGTDRNTDS